MTYLEAIKTDELILGMTDDKLILAMTFRDINPRDAVTTASAQNLELLTADLYSQILVQPNFSEGSLSIQYDKDKMLKYVESIARKYDDEKLLSGIASTQDSGMEDMTDAW